MKIKITNQEMVATINTFDAMGRKVIPRKLSFAIAKNAEKLKNEIYKPYYDMVKEIEKKHAKKDKDGKALKDEKGRIVYEDFDAYEKEVKELLEVENDFEAHEISEELLDQCEESDKFSNLTMNEAVAIMRFVKG